MNEDSASTGLNGGNVARTYHPGSLRFAAVLAAARHRSDIWDRPESGIGEADSAGVPAPSEPAPGNDAYRLGNRAASRDDWSTAKSWYEEAAQYGHPGAAFRLARTVLELQRREEVCVVEVLQAGKTITTGLVMLSLLRRAADGGHGDAARVLKSAKDASWAAEGSASLDAELLFRRSLLGVSDSDGVVTPAPEGIAAFSEPYQAEDPETLAAIADLAYPVIAPHVIGGEKTPSVVMQPEDTMADCGAVPSRSAGQASATPEPSPAATVRKLWTWCPEMRMELRGAFLEVLRSLDTVAHHADALAEALAEKNLPQAGSWAHALNREVVYGLSRVNTLARSHRQLQPMSIALTRSFTYKLPPHLGHARARAMRLGTDARLTYKELAHVGNDYQGCDLRSLDLEWMPLEGVRWSVDTVWPINWDERVRRASETEAPGVFVIRAEPERCSALSPV